MRPRRRMDLTLHPANVRLSDAGEVDHFESVLLSLPMGLEDFATIAWEMVQCGAPTGNRERVRSCVIRFASKMRCSPRLTAALVVPASGRYH